jgi:hypothetical protein
LVVGFEDDDLFHVKVFRITLIPAHFIEIVSEFFTQGADAKACGAVKTG